MTICKSLLQFKICPSSTSCSKVLFAFLFFASACVRLCFNDQILSLACMWDVCWYSTDNMQHIQLKKRKMEDEELLGDTKLKSTNAGAAMLSQCSPLIAPFRNPPEPPLNQVRIICWCCSERSQFPWYEPFSPSPSLHQLLWFTTFFFVASNFVPSKFLKRWPRAQRQVVMGPGQVVTNVKAVSPWQISSFAAICSSKNPRIKR